MTSNSSKAFQFWKNTDLGKAFDQVDLPPEVINHSFSGSGSQKDPYIVGWLSDDKDNPMNFCGTRKWLLNLLGAFSAFTVALASSAYSGALAKIVAHFAVTEEIALLGVSLFVIGFAVGPLLWAPLSEVYGRRYAYIASGAALTATLAGTAGAHNIETLLVLRFLSGSLGSAPMAISGGLIADLFPPATRGLALGLFVVAPFLGPALGPIIGGFMVERAGWRWVQGLLAIIAFVQWLTLFLFLPETYSPVLLKRRAQRLSKNTGHVYRTSMEMNHFGSSLMVTLSRPWVLLFREPIVLLISLYMSIIYGTLYMFFAAYPIIFQKIRGWSEGLGGLSFLGIMVGILLSIPGMFISHARYQKKASKGPKRMAPETRLPDSFIASVALPIGLFWFAWTNSPTIHWIVPIMAGLPFGFGCIMVFLPCLNYLVDSYTIYAASVIAANSALRSIFGAAFPLFTGVMYENLGIHWAASVPAFMALACVPIPYLLFVYGASIRKRCHYAAEADAFMERLLKVAEASTGQTEIKSKDNEVNTKSRLPEQSIPQLTSLERIGLKVWVRYLFVFDLGEEYDIDEVSRIIRAGYSSLQQTVRLANCEAVPDLDWRQRGVFKLQPLRDDDFEGVVVKDLRQSDAFPWSHKELKERSFPVAAFDANLICRQSVFPKPGDRLPTSLVQANFIRGGLVLNWCALHLVGDGASFHLWLKIWADGCRRAQHESLGPLYLDEAIWNDREALMKPAGHNKGRLENHPEYTLVDVLPASGPPPKATDPNQRTQLFYFSPESLQALKEEASPKNSTELSDQKWISTNDAVSALLWRSVQTIRNPLDTLEGDPISVLSISMDGRSRMEPKIHPDTLGCCLLWSAPSVSIRKMLQSLNLADLATIIRKAVSKADNQYTDDVMTLIDNLDDTRCLALTAGLDSAGVNCTQSSWASYPLYSLDWGSKLGHNMTSVRMPGNGPLDGIQIILPMLPDGGMEVLVGVDTTLLDNLLNEPLLKRFAVARSL
ncbi:uncharacterized protein N7511_009433 [Penicillium nucicola]|uniref:uncharacterized protein n=1 Tax=Penicillium nucicola TaxID=1850975 RepID=UPI002545BA93|nr:uncharacterized protein N7511_009433 [Penicillium nucicola]KAJ5747737.1 hypothetical protein N7511_009433 [Penicillium nucicola]